MISAIAAIGKNHVLGKNNELLWRIPADLKRFKALTMGHPIIMGRKTFDSIGKPLPGRTSIVITRDTTFAPRFDLGEKVIVVHSIEEAISKAKEIDSTEAFIIGGAQIYQQALPFIDRLYLTLIDDEKEGDAIFPSYETSFTKILKEEPGEHGGLKYKWIDLERE